MVSDQLNACGISLTGIGWEAKLIAAPAAVRITVLSGPLAFRPPLRTAKRRYRLAAFDFRSRPWANMADAGTTRAIPIHRRHPTVFDSVGLRQFDP